VSCQVYLHLYHRSLTGLMALELSETARGLMCSRTRYVIFRIRRRECVSSYSCVRVQLAKWLLLKVIWAKPFEIVSGRWKKVSCIQARKVDWQSNTKIFEL